MPTVAVVVLVAAVTVLTLVVVVGAGAAVGKAAVVVVLVVAAGSDADPVIALEAGRTLHGRDCPSVGTIVVVVHSTVVVLAVVVSAVGDSAIVVLIVVVLPVVLVALALVVMLTAGAGRRPSVRSIGKCHPDLGQVVEVKTGAHPGGALDARVDPDRLLPAKADLGDAGDVPRALQ